MAGIGRHVLSKYVHVRQVVQGSGFSSLRSSYSVQVKKHCQPTVLLVNASKVSATLHTCPRCLQESDTSTATSVSRLQRNALVLSKSLFEDASQDSPNKEAFKSVILAFIELDKRRRGHIQFIETALRYMKAFGVEKDVDAYNRLLDVFPKDKFIPKNPYQSMFNHYPEQQVCAIKVLQQMEDHAVLPNNDTKEILISVFGRKAHPVKKYQRLMYWFPKFRNINPFPLPKEMPTDPIKLSELGLKRISEYEAEFQIFSLDENSNNYIASVQSPDQREELSHHHIYRPLYVEGPYTLWLKTTNLSYYVLRTDPLVLQDFPTYERGDLPPAPQEGNVYAMCVTNDGSKETLNTWIKELQEANPHLARLTILFNLFDKKGAGNEIDPDLHLGEGTKMLES